MLAPQTEIQNIIQFFKDHNIAWLGDAGDKNGNLFADFLVQWGEAAKQVIDATPANLAIVYQKLQEAGRPFVYYSPAETQYHILEEQNGKPWCDAIWGYFPGHRLEATYDNFLTIANY